MSVHRKAALSLVMRKQLVDEIEATGMTLTAAAISFRVSRQTVRRWWLRYQEAGYSGLEDRSSRPYRCPRSTPNHTVEQIIRLRRERLSGKSIAQMIGTSAATVSRFLMCARLSRTRDLQPKEPDNRYEHEHPGDMIHVDIKQLSRFNAPGRRIAYNRSLGRSKGVGYDYLFVAVDDHSRLSFVGIYPDETKHSAQSFLDQALERFRQIGIPVKEVLTDNGRVFTSHLVKAAYEEHAVKHRRTRPYRPRTNGKAERFIQTLLREWAYAKPYANADERNHALRPWLQWYNEQRQHISLGNKTPMSRVTNVLKDDI